MKQYTEEEEMQIKELARRIDTGANMLGEWLSQLFKLYVDEEFPGENEWFGPDYVRMLGYLWALQNDLYAVEMLRNVVDEEDIKQKNMSQGLKALLRLQGRQDKPTIVCLCGSTRFSQAFQDHNLYETLKGNIVLSVGCNTKSDDDLIKAGIAINKEALDTLHLWKILTADEILVLDVDGYTGESTKREIEYVQLLGKKIRYLSEEVNEPQQQDNVSSKPHIAPLSEPSQQSLTMSSNENDDDSDDFDADKEIIALMMHHYHEKFKEQQ